MHLNKLGVGMYLLMTCWLIVVSMVRLMIEIANGSVNALPFWGLALGLLAMVGMGFGHVIDRPEE